MQKLLACSIGLLAAVASSPSRADTDIMDVYAQARVADPQLQAAEYRLRADRELKRQAFASFLPNVSGQYGITRGPSSRVSQNPEFPDTNVNIDRTSWSVTLTQPLFDKSIWDQRQQANHQVSQSEAEYSDTEQQFVLRVAQGYFDVLSARDNVRFTEAETRALERQLDQAEQRFQVGLSAITDVHEARARYDDARARLIVAQNDLDDAREQLQTLTGKAPGKLVPLKEELPLKKPDPSDPEAWVKSAVQQNPALEARRQAAEVADEQIDIARSGHYPTLGLQAQHNDDNDKTGLFAAQTESDTYTVQLSVPLFSGFAVSSQVDQAGYNYSAALQDVEQEQRSVVRETRDQYRAVLAGLSEVEARSQAVVSAQSALDATEAGFEVGTRTIVDVLISQQQLFQAQRDLAQARYNYLLSTLRLKQAAGVLSAQDLKQINTLLSVAAESKPMDGMKASGGDDSSMEPEEEQQQDSGKG